MTISDKKRYIKKECVYKLPWHFESDADYIEYFFYLNNMKLDDRTLFIYFTGNSIEIVVENKNGKALKMFTSYISHPVTYRKYVNAVVNVLYKLIKYLEG